MQRPLLHPASDDLKLESVLYALADPMRLEIVRRLVAGDCPLNCSTRATYRDLDFEHPGGSEKTILSH